MLMHRGFMAWITCDGKEIIEYESNTDVSSHKVACWIPSEEGKHFAVHWRDTGTGVDSATYIKLDGFTVPGHFLHGTGEACRRGVRVNNTSERLFCFEKVDRTHVKAKKGAENEEAGTIVVKVRQVKRVQKKPANPPLAPPHVPQGSINVGDHCVGFGQEIPTTVQTTETWSTEPHDPEKAYTFVKFVFRYRTREFLVSQGIMSRADPVYRTQEIAEPGHIRVKSPPPMVMLPASQPVSSARISASRMNRSTSMPITNTLPMRPSGSHARRIDRTVSSTAAVPTANDGETKLETTIEYLHTLTWVNYNGHLQVDENEGQKEDLALC